MSRPRDGQGSSRPNLVKNSVQNLTEASTEETTEETSLSSGLQQFDLDNALTNEAYLFMKKMLPSYIVNCFMATGYDTLEVLTEINNESLAEIEEIVNNEYPNKSCFRHQPIPTCLSSSSNVFKFQPGHRKRIYGKTASEHMCKGKAKHKNKKKKECN